MRCFFDGRIIFEKDEKRIFYFKHNVLRRKTDEKTVSFGGKFRARFRFIQQCFGNNLVSSGIYLSG